MTPPIDVPGHARRNRPPLPVWRVGVKRGSRPQSGKDRGPAGAQRSVERVNAFGSGGDWAAMMKTVRAFIACPCRPNANGLFRNMREVGSGHPEIAVGHGPETVTCGLVGCIPGRHEALISELKMMLGLLRIIRHDSLTRSHSYPLIDTANHKKKLKKCGQGCICRPHRTEHSRHEPWWSGNPNLRLVPVVRSAPWIRGVKKRRISDQPPRPKTPSTPPWLTARP